MWLMQKAGGESVSGYNGGGRSPIGVGGAVAVHAAVVAAWLLMPKEMIDTITRDILTTYPVTETLPPPPEPVPPETDSKLMPRPDPHPSVVKDPVIPPPYDPGLKVDDHSFTDTGKGDGAGPITPPVTPPLPDPVLVEASIDQRALAAFQPDYPGAMIRQGLEGKVTVRVTIGADGRVIDIEKLSATDDAFWLATQRHALRKWRFRPATRDGVAVSSSKVLTVHFKLTGL